MKIEIELDLEKTLSAALSPEKLAPILDKHIADALNTAISDATGYRSEFRKALTEQLTGALPHGLKLADVAKFQHILNGTLQGFVSDMNVEAVHGALAKAVANSFPAVPARLDLSDLLKRARVGFHKEDHEEFYAYAEKTDYGTFRLYLDADQRPGSLSYGSARDRRNRAAYCIHANEEGTVYSLKLGGAQITPSSRPDVIGEFEGALMAMYVGRTQLIVDMDAEEVEYAAQAQDD